MRQASDRVYMTEWGIMLPSFPSLLESNGIYFCPGFTFDTNLQQTRNDTLFFIMSDFLISGIGDYYLHSNL